MESKPLSICDLQPLHSGIRYPISRSVRTTGGLCGPVRALALLAALSMSGAAQAGVVFREVQVTEQAGSALRLVRQVISEGENCKILHEESTDPVAAVGSYVLATSNDAFVVDPARATVAPADPTHMVPAAAGEAPARPTIAGIALDKELDEAGPEILGLPTRHFVYRLRYELRNPAAGAKAPVLRHEERHEFYATPWTATLQSPAVWRGWRAAEDAGVGAERRDLREALNSLYDNGLFLKHVIERPAGGEQLGGGERVTREVTALSRQEIGAIVFVKPAGYSASEVLAPAPEDAPDAAPGDPGGGLAGAKARAQ